MSNNITIHLIKWEYSPNELGCVMVLRATRVAPSNVENAAICEKVAKCEKYSTLNVKIDAICEQITLNVKKLASLNVSNISTLNVLKSTLYVQTLF